MSAAKAIFGGLFKHRRLLAALRNFYLIAAWWTEKVICGRLKSRPHVIPESTICPNLNEPELITHNVDIFKPTYVNLS